LGGNRGAREVEDEVGEEEEDIGEEIEVVAERVADLRLLQNETIFSNSFNHFLLFPSPPA